MTEILDPKIITKYNDQLLVPPVYQPTVKRSRRTGKVKSHNYTIKMAEITQQILPHGFPKTTVWGYEGTIKNPRTGKSSTFRGFPGATIEAIRGIPVKVQWIIDTQSQLKPPQQKYNHALGTARLNDYSGLAGFYLLRDPKNRIERRLPKGPYEIPLLIQDPSFREDGSLLTPNVDNNSEIHPFLGNTISVNGKVWPNLNVKRRQYRFRILNGSTVRTYNLKLSNNKPFLQIGSNGVFLPTPVRHTQLLLGPKERADILIDFTMVKPGTSIILLNSPTTSLPEVDIPNPETLGQIMQFTVAPSINQSNIWHCHMHEHKNNRIMNNDPVIKQVDLDINKMISEALNEVDSAIKEIYQELSNL